MGHLSVTRTNKSICTKCKKRVGCPIVDELINVKLKGNYKGNPYAENGIGIEVKDCIYHSDYDD